MGTVEQLFEALSGLSSGLHDKGCGLLNVGGYYGPLVAFLEGAAERGFIRPEHRDMVLVDDDPERLLDRLASSCPPVIDKAEWIRSLSPSPHQEDTADESTP